MKKLLAILAASALIICALSGCGTPKAPAGEDGLSIVCASFPEYDWTRSILGDNPGGAKLTLLLDSGVDIHSYQPTADDFIEISDCDVFIYAGTGAESWVEEALDGAVNKDMAVLELLSALGEAVKTEETVEGMQPEDEHGGEEEEEADVHVWLSLKNAGTLCGDIAELLQEADPANTASYAENAESYIAELKALDAEYQAAVDGGAGSTVLFGDRFPFRYLMDDYGITYYAAFPGCSAETEASFETVVFLSGKVDELTLPCILTLEGSAQRIAETVADNTDRPELPILAMNSMQSVTAGDIEAGATYLGIMRDNLAVLKTALN